ncbi:1,4-dihydroxy-2-naphthoate octaprenyltransferase [Candidatus Bipolaricaulota bacterium]|nr:1,4-dihydroxy-2-naphthoate octaprenyltransferase [Candidatus Bipolaricaulota bacterium]
MNKLKALLIGSRPWSYPMTLASVLVGTLLALETGGLNFLNLGLVVLGTVLFHGTTNLINDYYDYSSGVDKAGSPTAKYRKQPLVEGWFEGKELLAYCVIGYAVVTAIGIYLTFRSGPLVLVFGMLGLAASYLYTGGGVQYKYLGWGEFSVLIVWGPLMVTGAYYVQAGALALDPVLVSLPLGLLVALVLLANNLRDREYDEKAGVNTIATLLDKKDALIIYFILIMVTYSTLGYLIVAGVLSPWGLLGFLSSPLAYRLMKRFFVEIPDDADAQTAKLDVVFGALLTISLVFENVI